MDINLRKFTKFVDKTFIEGGKEAKEPVLLVSVAAIFKNPWHGQGFVEDLRPIILDLAPKLGDLLVPELIKEIGSPEQILAYGKAGIVGLNGEIVECEDSLFIPGRCVQIKSEEFTLSYGEIHPRTLEKFELGYPAIGGEINW